MRGRGAGGARAAGGAGAAGALAVALLASCAGSSTSVGAAVTAPVASGTAGETSSTATATGATAATAPSVLSETPPVPAASSASSAASSATGTASASGMPSTACRETCTGGATPELVREATARAAQAKPCYDRTLVDHRSARGQLRVQVHIRGDGTICEARVLTSALPPDLDRCVVQILSRASYPPPAGGCIEMTVPFNFVPKSSDADAGVAGP